ncbi:glycine cleavage system aminomethyltransferase GcvT [Blastopirellula marina]|uniref:Aminomethyltransferase n=1 Tax=Blastopirellula marina TaxID=124 RepID=A0A2S8GTX0_9BACT|nr:glycine cleavage system aminomethyltransferase GcvT [Blastopirellula marina]PQO47877.1 glycine cleavage system protein T [Blastopirellula marina]
MTTAQLKKTPLYNWHTANGGRMVDFTGWSMPVQYTSIIDEHNATRKAVGLFDVSHMARFRFDGANALAFLDGLVTRKVADLRPGRIRYGLVCKEDGGILDDVLTYHLQDADGKSYAQMVVNAGNREKIAAWITERLPSDVTFTDQTEETAMIAVQGPHAIRMAQELVEGDLSELKYYQGREAKILSHNGLVSRTGYTGEDGVELTVPGKFAISVWEALHVAAAEVGGHAVGLGARDTLRLEAAMPLYGHELSEEITPLQAGLGFAMSWDHEFIGKAALEALDQEALPVRVGLAMQDRRVPREHYPLFKGDEQVGKVTSGSQSPTLGTPIAMGYVSREFSADGTLLDVDVRGKRHTAKVVPLPFYKRK